MKMMSLRQESCHVIIDVLVFKNHKHFNDIQIPYLISAVNDLLLKLNLHVTKPKEQTINVDNTEINKCLKIHLYGLSDPDTADK